MRLFVAIDLPEEALDDISVLRSGLPGAKWIDLSALHITLRFIGEVDGGAAEDVAHALSGIMAPMFQLSLSGIGFFESSGKIHSLWIGVERQPALQALQEKIELAITRAGQLPERRRFKPHVTIARFRNGETSRLGGYLQRYNHFAVAPFWVRHFTLFRSHLGSEKAYYEPVAEYFLNAGKGAAAFSST